MEQIKKDLIIPVYLNQRIVFDLLAVLQDGISTVTRVSSTESVSNMDDQRYGAAFGLNKAFSTLLKIDVSGNREKKKGDSSGVKRDEERFHTPTSLFQKLREIILQDKSVVLVDNNYTPKPHDLIEFNVSLKKNPIIETIDTFISVMDMASIFEDRTGRQKGHSKNEDEKIKKQMQRFANQLKSGDTIDVVSDDLACGYKSVVTLEQEYLNDPTMSDLVDGQFNVLGKIIRVIPDNCGSISLIRKTPLSVIPHTKLQELQVLLSKLPVDIDIPELIWEVPGPVMHVIPIAIFV